MVSLPSLLVDASDSDSASRVVFDLSLGNTGSAPLALAAYTLFVDIGADGGSMPVGVSWTGDPVEYLSGDGFDPLPGASGGAVNLTPAAGDLGVGQLQFFDSQVESDALHRLLSVSLDITPDDMIESVVRLSLAEGGQSTLASLESAQEFAAIQGKIVVISDHELPGDFNGDGTVGAADYTVWRDSFGEPASTLANAGLSGMVGEDHRDVWGIAYGYVAPQDPATSVPEPTSAGALLCGFAMIAFTRSSDLRAATHDTSNN